MFALTRLIIMSLIVAPMVASCGLSDGNPPIHRVDPNLVGKSPKLIIGRLAASDVSSQSLKVEFAAVHKDIQINSGADAEKAFNEGTPVAFEKQSIASHPDNPSIRYNMNLANNGDVSCPPGMNCSSEQFVTAGRGVGIFGGLFQGLIMRLKNLFSFLRPSTWLGNNGMTYGYQTQYGSGPNQYGVYVPNTQTPVYQPVPVQTYPGGPITTNPQYPTYPNTQPVNGQYPTQPSGQYPQTQPSTQYPPLPQGQEPMPTSLR